ncbi:MAG: hypothetical protein MK077_04710 [Phycisphaerales bacterium]|nr:hypothetical protein [Phycisphaerales bacterium]
MSWQDNWRHAFAVEREEDLAPTPRQMELVDTLCRAVVRRKMITPAILTLQMCRPLNFVAAQAMHFFRPIASVVLDGQAIKELATFLEQRGSVEYLCRRLEHWDRLGPDAEDATATVVDDPEGASQAPPGPSGVGNGPSDV